MDLTGFQGLRPAYYEAESSGTANLEAKLKGLQNKQLTASEKELQELDKVTKDLESVFTYMLMKEMRKTVPETGLISGGRGEEIFRDMLDEEMAKNISASGEGLGIAKMMYEQLSKPIIAKMKAEEARNEQGTAEVEKKLIEGTTE